MWPFDIFLSWAFLGIFAYIKATDLNFPFKLVGCWKVEAYNRVQFLIGLLVDSFIHLLNEGRQHQPIFLAWVEPRWQPNYTTKLIFIDGISWISAYKFDLIDAGGLRFIKTNFILG